MTEKERFDLYEQLIDWLGPVHAGTLMENLPPISWDRIATKDDVQSAVYLLSNEIGAQGTALRGEMSEMRGDLRSEMSDFRTSLTTEFGELRSEMSEFRTDLLGSQTKLRTELLGSQTKLRTELLGSQAEFRTELLGSQAEFRTDLTTDFNGRLVQLEERIGDKISAAQRANMAVALTMIVSIWLSIAAF